MALVVKIGGTVAADEQIMAEIIRELASLTEPAVLVHGGGKLVTELAGRLGIVSTFRDGIRLTQPDEMEIVDMVLSGRTNTELVRLAQRSGVSAVGLTGADGSLLLGRLLYSDDGGRTAEVERVNPGCVYAVQKAGFLPIVATVGIGEDGHAVNINADEAAQAIAQRWGEDLATGERVRLCYVSDIEGVLDPEGHVIPLIPTTEVEPLIARSVVQGGMAAKLRACVFAVDSGVAQITIGGYRVEGDLRQLIGGRRGTTVSRAFDTVRETGKGK